MKCPVHPSHEVQTCPDCEVTRRLVFTAPERRGDAHTNRLLAAHSLYVTDEKASRRVADAIRNYLQAPLCVLEIATHSADVQTTKDAIDSIKQLLEVADALSGRQRKDEGG